MNDISKLSSSLTETLKSDELQNTTIDLIEVFSDSLLKDGLLKDIPILGTLLGLTRTGSNIKDNLFTKKLLHFLFEFKNVSKEQKDKQIEKIELDSKYRIKVGERLLYIIDKCEDSEKAGFTGKLFNAYLEERIDYNDFLRCATCVERSFLPDLLNFIKSKFEHLEIGAGTSALISGGLMEIDQVSPKIKVEKNRASFSDELSYKIENSRITCSITYVGQLIREILG